MTDSRGNTYQEDRSTGAGTNGLHIFSSILTTALQAADTITVTTGVASVSKVAAAYTFSGIASSSWLDQVNSKTNGSTPTAHDTNAITTTVADTLLFDAFFLQALVTTTPDASWTEIDDAQDAVSRTLEVQYRIVSSTGAYTGTATSSAGTNSRAAIVSYKIASAAPLTRSSGLLRR